MYCFVYLQYRPNKSHPYFLDCNGVLYDNRFSSFCLVVVFTGEVVTGLRVGRGLDFILVKVGSGVVNDGKGVDGTEVSSYSFVLNGLRTG